MEPRIVIICHKNNRRRDPRRSVIHHLAEYWREAEIDVRYSFGVRRFVPADLAILHVGLSVVPDAYLRLARRYPIALNERARDIRKSRISRNLVTARDSYDGAVIVKSDLNYAGEPEARLRRFRRLAGLMERRRGARASRARNPLEYQIYESTREVPDSCFRDPRLVVEKFLPEKEGDLYFVRLYEFLGDRTTCIRLAGRHPIVNSESCIGVETVDPHPHIEELRREMGFDYGKFDYVIHDGAPVLLDTNTTTGAGSLGAISPENEARRRYRAEGIYAYLGS